jgi:hypothetical protein
MASSALPILVVSEKLAGEDARRFIEIQARD